MSFEKPIASEITKLVFGLIKKTLEAGAVDEIELEPNLDLSIKSALNWSRNIQFFGMPSPINTSDASIELMIRTTPRKFSNSKNVSDTLSEIDLVKRHENIVLLGQPGSGKTTTIKRLINHLISEPADNLDNYCYPIIIKIMDLSDGESLSLAIANYLGFKVESKSLIESSTNEYNLTESYEVKRKYIGDNLLGDVIPKILDETRAIVLIDGLDEAIPNARFKIENELALLSNKLNFSKMIVTCRSGDYFTQIDGFSVFELKELGQGQVAEMIEKWAGDPACFNEFFCKTPYMDVANKPLFLAQIITIFNLSGELPEQPFDIYKKLTRLVVEDWDKQHRQRRISKYSNFGTEKKLQFLATIAYELTYVIKTKRFTTSDLVKAYQNINGNFGLPFHEAEQVAEEIESHTGLITKSGYKHFEFSHLSLQEFLCADYLVRDPVANVIVEYFQEYPAPLAVAVTMAAKPSNWFSLVLLNNSQPNKALDKQQLNSFLQRLLQERPMFTKSVLLGGAVLKVLFSFNVNEQKNYFSKFIDLDNISSSLGMALKYYQLSPITEEQDFYILEKRFGCLNEYSFNFSEKGEVHVDLINEIIISTKGKLVEATFSEMLYFSN